MLINDVDAREPERSENVLAVDFGTSTSGSSGRRTGAVMALVSPGITRVVLALDIEGYSSRLNLEQMREQERLDRARRASGARASSVRANSRPPEPSVPARRRARR
ncbi:hypothetical protein GA0115259_102102 [Streptomyces sp. MnatMP-M17]|nr:hypothetical protein GA0115259_102102 [Streptomyces sp. MnatMP-M17]